MVSSAVQANPVQARLGCAGLGAMGVMDVDANVLCCTVTLNLSDADFQSLVTGKANAQRLFMGGKLKIKGNIMKATKMEPVLKKAQGKAKL